MTRPPTTRSARLGRWASILAELVLVAVGASFIWATYSDLVLAAWCVLGTAYAVVTIAVLTVASRRPALTAAPAEGRVTARVEYAVSVLSTLLASLVGLWAAVELILLRSSAEGATAAAGAQDATEFSFLGVWAMLLSWGLLHWGFAQAYRYLYYSLPDPPLRFPQTDFPTVVDFAYFSYTLGTSFAVSDVETRGSRVRWILVWHSVISFLFNGLIIVLALNTIMGGGR